MAESGKEAGREGLTQRRRVLDVNFTYPHSYEVEEVREIPGTGKLDIPVLYFPRPSRRKWQVLDRSFCIRLYIASGLFARPQFG
jgi:hypothetical protein